MDLTSIENFRKQNKITTRKFAEMCKIAPSRYCDLKFNRENPTVQEGSNIINAVVKIKKLGNETLVKVEEGTNGGFDFYCQCGNYLSNVKDKTINYCPKCGQKLDWD
ncbi:hypothetical protein [Clostridium taeniosporum]|uniref:Uncharacterized protein n=1 Tax=Clostridium taeniosporum TaxID=394958 RepID=A0A1D7XLW4_9CLOT|nr:hypothetical protein [Clostridium taeniosporum]AOR24321.1 hypothetical protein BGI42_11500 [Clostridium taeniosporum]